VRRALALALAAGLASVGVASLALTLYLWFGDWPQGVKAQVDYLRSSAETAALPPEPLIAHATGRGGVSLGGRWQALVDPGSFPLAELAGWLPRGVEPTSPADLVEAAFDPDVTLAVPGDWNSQDERLFFYEGAVWYRRSFEALPEPGRRHFLHFGAANYEAQVFLNGRALARHRGGFTPFVVEIGDALRRGENLLVVKVSNEHGPGDVPTPSTDWFNYGGLTRDVLWLELPETFLRDYSVGLAAERDDRVVITMQLDGSEPSQSVSVSIPELGVEASARSDATGAARFEIEARPELWSPADPKLYRVELRAGEDAVSEEIGFRRFEVRGPELLLNGEPVFLRGIALHEEAPGGGRAHGPEHAATLLGWARELGCNFVRLAHYPHDEHTTRLADRLGLLVWSEIPVYWNVDFARPDTLELAKQQLGEMIARDRNRASVVLWSLANETPHGEERDRFLAALAEHARALDPTRPLTAALLSGPGFLEPFLAQATLAAATGRSAETWTLPIEDPLAELIDVAALNEYFGWYYTSVVAGMTPMEATRVRRAVLENLPRIRFALPREMPLVVSELGAGARHGVHAPESELAVFSEELQALVYRRQIEMLRQQPSLRGVSPWVLMDFRSALRLLPGVQDHWNRKGLVSPQGERKQAFDVLRGWYAELARSDQTSRAPPSPQ